jgi:hypothetical protein
MFVRSLLKFTPGTKFKDIQPQLDTIIKVLGKILDDDLAYIGEAVIEMISWVPPDEDEARDT